MALTVKEVLFGKPRSPLDPRVFESIALAAFLAWVGLGADGLSSSCYGPEEAYLALGQHHHLVWPLAALVAITIFSISASYSQVVSLFPAGGGGYLVATKLLGPIPGVVSGTSLIVDYILTISISCASGVAALLSFAPASWQAWHEPLVLLAVLSLITLNLRGVKESVKILLPIFLAFFITHLVLIIAAFAAHSGAAMERMSASFSTIRADVATTGLWPLLVILIRAFALGGGTFTGIEAVSNSMQIFKEPKVATARRTMLYMALSLAFTAAGILLAYRILGVEPHEGRPLNAVLFESLLGKSPIGHAVLVLTMAAEGGLLFVAAQAGFIDGPRVLASMAVDGWVPRQFSRLSDRLVIQNGVLVMGSGAVAFVMITGGDVKKLVILYSISVFITFVLTQTGLTRHWIQDRNTPQRLGKIALNGWGLLLTLTILIASLVIKLPEGAWISLLVIAALIVVAAFIRSHYRRIAGLLATLDKQLTAIDPGPKPAEVAALDPRAPTAILLVNGYNGLGLHALLTVFRMFPKQFRNMFFVSVGVIDYDRFRGEAEIEKLKQSTEAALKRYVDFAQRIGYASDYRMAMGTDPVDELARICPEIMKEYNQSIVFGGQLAFPDETIATRFLHSQVAFEIQRRLQFAGLPVVILPVRAIERT